MKIFKILIFLMGVQSISAQSPSAFSERMKMETGLSPINFLIKIRINIAMNLMAHFNYKIGDIAYETGFYSPQHFSLTFKKMTGVSPHKYRKTYYEKQL